MSVRLYPYFSTVMLVLLLISAFSPWIVVGDFNYRLSDILFNPYIMRDVINFLMGGASIFHDPNMRLSAYIFSASALVYLVSLVLTALSIRFRRLVIFAVALSIVSVFIFSLGFNRFIYSVSSYLVSFTSPNRLVVDYGVGVYIALIAGGVGIIGFLMPYKDTD